MKIPRMLLGQRGEVKQRVEPIIRAMTGGDPLTEAAFGPLISIQEAPNALILTNPGRGSSGDEAFHCYALLYGVMEAMIKGRVKASHFDEAFGWSLGAAWSFAGSLGEAGTTFFLKMPREAFTKEPPPEILRGKPEWYAPFLKAALTHWEVLAQAGTRFAMRAGGEAFEFSRVSFAINQVLVKCNVASEDADVESPAKVHAAILRALARLEN